MPGMFATIKAITASATQIAQVDSIHYFVTQQLPLMLPMCVVLMITYYFVNRYFDSKIEISKIEEKAQARAQH